MGKEFLEKDLVVHAYDNVIERCARLNAFSGNLIRNLTFDDIIMRQETLAIDDIITLSISARRLVAVCGITPDKSRARVRKWRFRISPASTTPVPMNDYVSLEKLFGIVIHCETFDVIESELIARIKFDPRDGVEVLALYGAKELEDK